jgi:adenine-specific DNA-methyltransferase
LPQHELTPDGWRLIQGSHRALLERLRHVGTPLGTYAKGRFHNGVKSGLTEAFVVDTETTERIIAKEPRSKDVIRPYFRGRNLRRWAIEPEGLWLIYIPWHFPLHNDSSITEASAKAEREFRKCFPEIYSHLLQFKPELSKRDKRETGFRYEWYAHARPRFEIHADFESPKVVLGIFMNKPTYAYDDDGYFPNNAQFCIGRDDSFLVGILNSPCAWWFLTQTCTDLQNGYLQALLANQEPIPIPDAIERQKAVIDRLVRTLVLLTKLAVTGDSSRSHATRDPLMLAYWERVLNGLVYELYFPEELHGADLYLFDLVESARLPNVNSLPETDRLPTLRKLFEALYEGTHPIRIALDKLQTLDTVRIIEGRP